MVLRELLGGAEDLTNSSHGPSHLSVTGNLGLGGGGILRSKQNGQQSLSLQRSWGLTFQLQLKHKQSEG